MQRLNKGQDSTKISPFRGLQLVLASWNDITGSTFVNCFRKAKVYQVSQDINLMLSIIEMALKALEDGIIELR